MDAIKKIWEGFLENARASIRWASVQLMAFWGVIFGIYSQLPIDVITQLAETKFLYLNVPGWMAVLSTFSTYLARVKKPKDAA